MGGPLAVATILRPGPKGVSSGPKGVHVGQGTQETTAFVATKVCWFLLSTRQKPVSSYQLLCCVKAWHKTKWSLACRLQNQAVIGAADNDGLLLQVCWQYDSHVWKSFCLCYVWDTGAVLLPELPWSTL